MTHLTSGNECHLKFDTTRAARDRFYAACKVLGCPASQVMRWFFDEFSEQIESELLAQEAEAG